MSNNSNYKVGDEVIIIASENKEELGIHGTVTQANALSCNVRHTLPNGRSVIYCIPNERINKV